MKVSDAMMLFTKYAGAPVEDDLKYRWLQSIEDIIYNEIILTHHSHSEKPALITEGDRDLTAPDPYSELYIHYMNMQNDLFLRDHNSYANSSVAFAVSYASYADWYNRTHMPNACTEEINI